MERTLPRVQPEDAELLWGLLTGATLGIVSTTYQGRGGRHQYRSPHRRGHWGQPDRRAKVRRVNRLLAFIAY